MSSEDPNVEGVAIIGLAGRFPGARNVAEFWRNLLAGEETIADVSGPPLPGPGPYIPRRGLLEKPEWFDAAFFGIPPREAEVLDPQQRVFMEECWTALEDAACDPTRYPGAIGVFAGMSNNTYWVQNLVHHPELTASVGWLTAMMGNEKDYLATRTAYKLNLRGPALNIYTACSTSLVAVCQAVQGLLNYSCDVALAGGVSITFPHERGYHYDEGGILSPDGHCRAFDVQAAGTVFSNGVGVVVLKRLAEAIADGDQIYAVIKGAALNNDGSNKVSFTAPSVEGHAEVIALAHALAGIEARTIGYVEAHGTGTPLGDPIEIAGLTRAFATSDRAFCAIGSVKTNIGHLDAAAGIAGLIKTALALKHGRIPPSLHFTAPNPQLGLESSPFFVATQALDWPTTDGPRRAGVSSFGVGGTNAHVVLEEPPVEEPQNREATAGPQILVLSAKSEAALAQRANDLADHLEEHPGLGLAETAFTLQLGRTPFDHRRAFICPSREIAISALRGFEPRRTFSGIAATRGTVFMFPGQGAQYLGMGAQLYEREPTFRKAFDTCCDILRGEFDLRAVVHGAHADATAARTTLRETRFTQPAIFALSYSLAQLWLSWGVQPSACIGHSVGEYVAATLADVFSLPDALRLVAARAQLVQAQAGGAMLAARISESDAARFIGGDVALAAVNGPRLLVLAGPEAAIQAVENQLSAESIPAKRLETSHAFHSPMMDSVIAPLRELAQRVERRAPKIPIFSTVSVDWLTPEQAEDPDYWARHAREAVRFSPAIARLLQEQSSHLIECGPGNTLGQLVRQQETSGRAVVGSIREGAEELATIRAALGELWTRGVNAQWTAVHQSARRLGQALPTYPFERKRYFADAPTGAAAVAIESIGEPRVEQVVAMEESAVAAAAPKPALSTETREQRLLHSVLAEMRTLSGLELSPSDAAQSFTELGFDSLFLTQLAVAFQKRFKIKVTFRQLLQDLPSPGALAAHLDSHLGADFRLGPGELTKPASPPACTPSPTARAHGPFRGIDSATTGPLNEQQREHLNHFVTEYSQRTAGSKRHTAEHRAHLADPRAIAGFRREWKEIVYPLVCERSEAARLWDIDGNEYLDITLGFGQILFGHRPPFLVSALENQLRTGIEIGPTSPRAGELAARLSRFLGLERVAFCNTGSEAVAAALRLARTVTGRDRVVVFSGGYHGIFDEVLFRPGPAPIAPGIPQSAVENLVVLEYGTDEALDWIRDHANELAAVMIEPIQSRNPALVPLEFVREIRKITRTAGAVLILDEIVTGFRIAPRGAQEFFGVQADLATYGKIIGGGVPIGIVAGSRQFMDALDGGAWNYGDESFPEVGVTFFAGTFVRHPLALAAASAVLDQLEAGGPELQQDLSEKAAKLASGMNSYLELCEVPLRWEQFASLYHLPIPAELRYAPLIFAHMRLRGVHAWENRPCFLCTSHSADDLARVLQVFQESVHALVSASLLPGKVVPPNNAAAEISPSPNGTADLTNPAEENSEQVSTVVTPHVNLRQIAQPETPAESTSVDPPVEAGAPPLPSITAVAVSDAQGEILLAARLSDEANASFNDSVRLHIRGSVDGNVLNQALTTLANRHEALRTSFSSDLFTQLVHSTLTVPLTVVDLATVPPSERAAMLAGGTNALKPFDLTVAPLWRATLIQVGKDEHELHFTAHHAICDGWSFSIVASELAALYGAAVRQEPDGLRPAKPLRILIEEQREQEQSPEFSEHEQWWIKQFRNSPPLLDLPLDHGRTSQRSFHAATQTGLLSKEVCERLRALAGAERTTVFSVLLAAFYSLLHRLSGQSDLVVGIASAGQAGIAAPLVGHCVSFLPLRVQVQPTMPFRDVVSQVNTVVLDAKEHAEVTFGRLLRRLKLPRQAGRMPLTAVSFNVDRSPGELPFGDARAEYLPLPKELYHLELSFNLIEEAGGYRIFCHFNRDLFSSDTVARWISHYATLLEAATEGPETPVDDLPLLSAEEAKEILVDWNNTTRGYPSDVGIDSLFEAVAAEHSDSIAIHDGPRTFTYEALNIQANMLANQLLADGISPGSLVGICLERSAELVIASLAVLKMGCAYVPLDPTWPAERLHFMATDGELATVITRLEFARHFRGKATQLDGPRPPLPPAPTDPKVSTDGSTPAYVIYTSGSTGTPKGVIVPHRAIARLVINTDYAQLTPNDVVGHASNPAFDAATFEIWGPLLNGGRIVVLQKAAMLDSQKLGAAIRDEGITALFLTTALFNKIAAFTPNIFKPLKHLLVGGDAANPTAFARVLQHGAPTRLSNIYGPTEVTTFACAHLLREIPAAGANIPIGRPIANTDAFVLDDRLRPVPIGVPGELYLGGDGLALGYRGRADLTEERFIASPFAPERKLYKTGDRVRWNSSGQIQFLGRFDNQVKLRGFRVELGEIEAALADHPSVREAAVKVIGHTAEDKSLAGYIVPKNGAAPNPEDVRTFLRHRLPEFMIPTSLRSVESLPLNANGKVDRAALPDPEQAPISRGSASRSPVELRVADLMAATLGLPSVSVHDDFFRLGGHSLLAMDLLARLRKAFGLEVPTSELFENATPAAVAKYIAQHQPRASTRTDFRFLVPIQRGAPGRAPLFLVAGGWGGEIEFLVYAQLARLLDPEQPIYGLKARGAGTPEPPHVNVGEMAADYLAEIRALQPCGPYWLAGECVGGICAHEMACQLRDAGEEVAALILLDTSVPSPDELQDYLAREEEKTRAAAPPPTLGQRLRKIASSAMRGKVRRLLKKLLNRTNRNAADPTANQHPRGQAQYPPTLMRHQLRKYPGCVTLLVDADSFRLYGQLGWENAPIGDLELHVLRGDHITYIREEGAHAAQKLRELLVERVKRS